MTDGDLIGFALDLLDPDDRAAVAARLPTDPDLADRLARVRAALLPLDADRDTPEPPPGLVARAVARVAALFPAAVAPPRLSPARLRALVAADGPDTRGIGGRFRLDWLVAAGVAFLAVGLTLSTVNRARAQRDTLACQNNLREVHGGLTAYADAHGGRFPQAGVTYRPPAGNFAAALTDAGQLPVMFTPACPASPRPTTGAGPADLARYTYTLGYRTAAGDVAGLRLVAAGENDLIPIAADNPRAEDAPPGGPVSPHVGGQNVLFVGGHVRFATCALVGLHGDDVYRNAFGHVAAGRDRTDAVLGRAADIP